VSNNVRIFDANGLEKVEELYGKVTDQLSPNLL